MTISGPEMHRQIMAGYRAMQETTESLRTKISAIDESRQDLAEDRNEALIDLAQHYLPELTRESIQKSWIGVRQTLTSVMLRKEDHRRRLAEAQREMTDRRHLEEDRLLEVNQTLDEATDNQQTIAAEVEKQLSSDERFVSLTHEAAAAEAALERAEDNLNEIEQDASRKLPSYEDSSLFRYLKNRKFGTSDYQSRGLTRRMDRWVANFIDYRKAKQGYDFLVDTPDRMRKIIAEDRQSLDTVMSELERQRDSVADRLGLSAAVVKVEQLSKQRDSRLTVLDGIRKESEQLDKDLTALEDTQCEYYEEAIQAFRGLLDGMKSDELSSQARGTASITDDQIVARIQGTESEIERSKGEERRQESELQAMTKSVDAMGRFIQRFRASNFDSARSTFLPSVDVIDALHRVRTERDVEDLWDRLRKAQRWGPTFGEKVTGVAAHPVTQVLIGAMAHAAGSAMSQHAKRAGRRRHQSRRHRNVDWFGDSSFDLSNIKKWKF
ncbi:MAG: hypothetical protein AAGJ83_01510 [Planctomycetota bacterium]